MTKSELKELWKIIQKEVGASVDGIPGVFTAKAVSKRLGIEVAPISSGPDAWRAVQKKIGLTADGIAGPLTAKAVYQSISGNSTPETNVASGKYKEVERISPNKSVGGNSRKYLILHHSDGWSKTGDPHSGDISHCLKASSKVSYNTIIAWNGDRTVLVKDDDVAWHAGKSSWKGESSLNNKSIGVAFGGNTVTGAMRPNGQKTLTKDELASFVEWAAPRVKKYNWTRDSILTHKMVAPGRKVDTSDEVRDQILKALNL